MRELGVPYEVVPDPETTKSKIILIAAEQFAMRGYNGVSVKEIAKAAGILASSLYSHFESKQEILETMMTRYEEELYDFYSLQKQLARKATSFREILENNIAEVKETVNPFSYYVLWCAITTQFQFECSRHVFYDVFYEGGRASMREQLELAIARGLSPPFDTEVIAHIIMDSVMGSTNFHIGKLHGFYSDYDISGWISQQVRHILKIVGLADR